MDDSIGRRGHFENGPLSHDAFDCDMISTDRDLQFLPNTMTNAEWKVCRNGKSKMS